MSEPACLAVHRDGPIATVTMNRPEVFNAFDEQMIDALRETFAGLAEAPSVRAIVLQGAGKHFSAGADVAWMRRAAAYGEAENRADARRLALMLKTIDECPKPVVARVHGAALGGGTGLVAACDIAIASEGAVFGTTEVRLGLAAAVISPFVLRAIGPRQARRLFLTGERIDAARARTIGLVHEVVPEAELDRSVGRVLDDLLAGGPEAQAASKELIRTVLAMPQGGSILTEATVAVIAARRASPEGKEGLAAFLDKRPPAWRIARGGST
ncbi:MAG: enoyl-CoA hydratase-related protein [Geminicoccaceae bacterium]|nr:enoyl-CoA hydratase-related protein [Geminicoccaceae bacterium]MCX8102192.1 enoyl-CoA hydratase-related protein [Geminicoccaceae bacterium]